MGSYVNDKNGKCVDCTLSKLPDGFNTSLCSLESKIVLNSTKMLDNAYQIRFALDRDFREWQAHPDNITEPKDEGFQYVIENLYKNYDIFRLMHLEIASSDFVFEWYIKVEGTDEPLKLEVFNVLVTQPDPISYSGSPLPVVIVNFKRNIDIFYKVHKKIFLKFGDDSFS